MGIFDVSNPICPIRLDSFDVNSFKVAGVVPVLGIDVKGNVGYVASGSGLHIVNVTNPASPFRVGGYDFVEGGARNARVVGDTAFAAASSGLQILDVATPSSPKLVASFSGDTSGCHLASLL